FIAFIFDQRPKQTYKRLSRRTKPAHRRITLEQLLHCVGGVEPPPLLDLWAESIFSASVNDRNVGASIGYCTELGISGYLVSQVCDGTELWSLPIGAQDHRCPCGNAAWRIWFYRLRRAAASTRFIRFNDRS